jgi:hypothetical protein
LKRRYRVGDEWSYRMEGVNNGDRYTLTIAGAVRQRADGRSIDELTWPGPQDLRQVITLDGTEGPFSPADVAAGIAKAPRLVGPFTDMLTFYADLYLAMHHEGLRKAGDHVLVPNPQTGSWADGQNVIVGEDHVDFDLTLSAVDSTADTATLIARHIPPPTPKIRFPADWMRPAVAGTPNNFVEVKKTASGYAASIGKETFDVTLRVRLSDGLLLGVVMDNPVVTVDRQCADASLSSCGEAREGRILRHVELKILDR